MNPDYITVSGTTDAFTQVFEDLSNPAPVSFNPYYDYWNDLDDLTWVADDHPGRRRDGRVVAGRGGR